VLETPDPAKNIWMVASAKGFGDPQNLSIFEMAVFNDHLYAGTLNAARGFQIWKTRADGAPPYRWTKIISDGAYRGALNEAVLSMCVFRGALYVGSCIQNGGHDLTHHVGPAAPELIRIYPDDSWDLIVGEARRTPQGWCYPLSGFGPGFDNAFNGYFWRLAEFQGWLYVGTLDSSVLLSYQRSIPQISGRGRLLQAVGVNNLVRFNGGFDIYRSKNGVDWVPVTTNGFGNPYNFGARTLVATPRGLFVGTANPFGPEVALPTPTGWIYSPNPQGGAEVWLGTPLGCYSGT
jgi:hypothetical protein